MREIREIRVNRTDIKHRQQGNEILQFIDIFTFVKIHITIPTVTSGIQTRVDIWKMIYTEGPWYQHRLGSDCNLVDVVRFGSRTDV